jgi:glycosyltransferase involved in cell wall biosynthesis
MTPPKISVVMSVHNGERYLAEAVQSVLNQTFRDFELIIINDGSTDRTGEILEGFARAHSRIRLISRENKGLSYSLNEGVLAARGEWVARMDADDVALPYRFDRQLRWLEKSGADIGGSSVRVIGTWRRRVWVYPSDPEEIKARLLFNSAFAHPAIMARRSVLTGHVYADSSLPSEDYHLWTRLALAGVRMTNCPDVLLNYRLHNSQISAAKQGMQQMKRDSIAAAYWSGSGYKMPGDSIIRFSSVTGLADVLGALRGSVKKDSTRRIIYDGCWKMAMRSGSLGLPLFRQARKSLELTPFQLFALFCVCLTGVDLDRGMAQQLRRHLQ